MFDILKKWRVPALAFLCAIGAAPASAAPDFSAMTTPICQSFNPGLQSNLLTPWQNEINNASQANGFADKRGTLFLASLNPANGLVAVSRMYNPNTNDFFLDHQSNLGGHLRILAGRCGLLLRVAGQRARLQCAGLSLQQERHAPLCGHAGRSGAAQSRQLEQRRRDVMDARQPEIQHRGHAGHADGGRCRRQQQERSALWEPHAVSRRWPLHAQSAIRPA